MSITQFAALGDSLTHGDTGTFDIVEGGSGCFAELVSELLADLPGVGPLLGAGFRGVWRTTTGEWARAGSWTQTVSTDAFDKAPHGQAWYANNGSGSTTTYTKPAATRAIVGFAVYWIDYTGGGNWQYRIDGGTWTNHGQTVANNNALKKFYVSTAVTSTVDFRAFDGSSNAGVLIAGIEPFFRDPTTATSGFIFHNLGSEGKKLHDAVLATSGDRLAWFDTVTLGTGSPITNTPTMTWTEFINDVLNNDTSQYNTDLTTLHGRAANMVVVSPYEADTATYDSTRQANYRSQAKTTSTNLSLHAPFDLFDVYSNMGFGAAGTQNAALIAAGLTYSAGTHPSAAGHADIATRLYWYLRENLFTIGTVASAWTTGYTVMASDPDPQGGIPTTSVTVTQTQTPTLPKQVGHVMPSVTETQTPTIVRSAGKIVSVVETQTATIVRSIGKLLTTVTETQTPTIVRSAGKIVSAVETQTASIVRSVGKRLSVTETQTPILDKLKAFGVTLSVTQTQTLTALRSIAKTFTATDTQTPTTRRTVGKIVTATETQTPSIVRSIGKRITVTANQVLDLMAQFGGGAHNIFNVTLSVVQTQTPTLVTAFVQFVARTFKATFRADHRSTYRSDHRSTFREDR